MTISKPELVYIALCREVRENEDGSRDLLGIFGSLIGSSSLEEMPPLKLALNGIVAFYLEDKTATYPIRLTMQKPDGREIEMDTAHVGKFGHLHTQSITVICSFTFRNQGTYWFCCYWNDQLLGRYPLTIGYQMLDEEAALN